VAKNRKNKSVKFYVYLDIDKYTECIENNKSIDSLYPESWNIETAEDKFHEYMKSVILEGEEYRLLNDKFYNYALTSFGRAFNVEAGKSVRTYVLNTDMYIFVRNKRENLSNAFARFGWHFDYNTILARFNVSKRRDDIYFKSEGRMNTTQHEK
jgi:hypothetical protein